MPDLSGRCFCGAVRWSDSIRTMIDAGVDDWVELGHGRVLAGLMKTLPEMLVKAKKKYPTAKFYDDNLGQKIHRIAFQNGFDFVKKHF